MSSTPLERETDSLDPPARSVTARFGGKPADGPVVVLVDPLPAGYAPNPQ